MTGIRAENRKPGTKSELRKLRERGKVPGTVSGKKLPPVSIAVDEKELLQLLQRRESEIVELDLPDYGKQPVMVKEVQRDTIVPSRVLHVDFHQISLDRPVKATVRLQLNGEAAGVKEGGVLQTVLEEVEVKAMPKDLPAVIEADISGLGIGDKLVVADLQMPPGVECLSDPDTVIVTVLQVRKAEQGQDEETAEAAGGEDKETSGADKP